MKLITNVKKKKLNHMILAAKAVGLKIFIGPPLDMANKLIKDHEDYYGIYAKKEDYTEFTGEKYWIAIERLGIKILKQWEAKGYEVGDALGFQFYLDMPEEEVKIIEQDLKKRKKYGI